MFKTDKKMEFEEMLRTHKDFVTLMPDFFGLLPETAKTIPLRFSPPQQDYKKGRFYYINLKIPEIVLIPEDHNHPLDLLFTCAHESAHYLHFLARPEFYTELKEDYRGICREKTDRSNFIEGVADIAAFEFLRIRERLKEFIQLINSMKERPYKPDKPFDELANYHIYKHFRANGELDKIIKAEFRQDRRIMQYCDALYYLRLQLGWPYIRYKPKRVPWAEIPADRLSNTVEICKEI